MPRTHTVPTSHAAVPPLAEVLFNAELRFTKSNGLDVEALHTLEGGASPAAVDALTKRFSTGSPSEQVIVIRSLMHMGAVHSPMTTDSAFALFMRGLESIHVAVSDEAAFGICRALDGETASDVSRAAAKKHKDPLLGLLDMKNRLETTDISECFSGAALNLLCQLTGRPRPSSSRQTPPALFRGPATMQ